jgi:AcrR family transcriptional regulator
VATVKKTSGADAARATGTSTRVYNSPVREESARRTRLQIVDAARELFLERGYASCSVTDIAASAGVARPTVLSVFGSKAQLLREVVDVAMAGDDEPVPIAERRWFQPVWQATAPADCLVAYAHVCTLISRRSAAVVEVVRRASDENEEVGEQWATLQRNRRTGARTIVSRARELGPLAPGLTSARAVDLLWWLNDQHHYTTLVTASGWSEKSFDRWLARQMTHQLLG